MKRVLVKKFEKELFKNIFLEMGKRKLIYILFWGKIDFWIGKWDKKIGVIVGENIMGKFLMEVRDIM